MWLRARLLVALLLSGCVDLTPPAALKVPPGGSPAAGADGGIGNTGGTGGSSVEPTPAPGVPDAAATAGSSAPGRDASSPAILPLTPDAPAAPTAPPDTAPPPPPLLADGKLCAAAGECQSGACVDGVCCNSPCTQFCYACAIQGSVGTCTPIAAGLDPDSECGRDPRSTCEKDGTCDGRGGCRLHQAGTECAPGSCTGTIESSARTCDGRGTCRPPTSRSCLPQSCLGDSCATRCDAASPCQEGFFCDAGGACKVKLEGGKPCASGGQCKSTYCTDGVCCDGTCTELCHACNLATSPGLCSPVPLGSGADTDCPAEPRETCRRAGGCNGTGACLLHRATTPCAAQTCAGGAETGVSTCDGAGSCKPGPRKDCGAYQCADPGSCATTCTADEGCKPGLICPGGSCVPPPADLALYWKFDEDAGTVARDSSGHHLDGTYGGMVDAPVPSPMLPPTRFTNPRSRAFLIASRQIVQLTGMPDLLRPANNFTLSAWYRATKVDPDGPGSEIISGGNQYLLRLEATGLRFSKRINGSSVQCRVDFTGHLDGAWHHLAATSTTAGTRLYFDGVERCSDNHGESVKYDLGNDFLVGRHGDKGTLYDFDGNIDEVRVYTRALSGAEILSLAQGNF
jgi:hypothetical protein